MWYNTIFFQFHNGVYLVLMMGLLEGYYVPLYMFHFNPVGFDEKVRWEGGGQTGWGGAGEEPGEDSPSVSADGQCEVVIQTDGGGWTTCEGQA